MESSYKNKKPSEWLEITKELIQKHPLSIEEIKEVVLESWEDILCSKIGKKPYYIGKDILPKPQIMGFLLHELIPLKFENRYPGEWRKEKSAKDKDLIYIADDIFSIEIKTSSSSRNIFGNRSYAQKAMSNKKKKFGFYLAINFEKFSEKKTLPRILKVRFGWLDHDDWTSQKAPTGQQARLSREVEENKLIELYKAEL